MLNYIVIVIIRIVSALHSHRSRYRVGIKWVVEHTEGHNVKDGRMEATGKKIENKQPKTQTV